MLSFLKKCALFLNILFALALIASDTGIYVDPAHAWYLSFFGLLFPVWLIANIFFVFFWIIIRLKYSLISIITIAATFAASSVYFGFHFSSEKKNITEKTFSVMSYNVRNFNVYHWNGDSSTATSIVKMINREKPDIICFQEFYDAPQKDFSAAKIISQQTDLTHFFFQKNFSKPDGKAWGTAIFSKYPIMRTGSIAFHQQTSNSCSFADIKIDSIVYRVFNVHLQSVYLSQKDYNYINDLTQNQDVQLEPSKELLSKYKKATLLRSEQAEMIEDSVAHSPHPSLVCGDFNDPPTSYSHHVFSQKLHDSFLQAGGGIGSTYDGFLNLLRIDYIFTDYSLRVTSYKCISEKHSDHYPIKVVCTPALQ